VLAAAHDVAHRVTGETALRRRRQRPAQRRVQHPHADDATASDRGAQDSRGMLDFRQLRHLDLVQRHGDATPESIAHHLALIPGTSYSWFVSSAAHATPPPAPGPRSARAPAIRNTLIVILALNLLVVVVKIAVGVHTGALSVLGAALESGLDVFNNLLGIVLVGVAARDPDEEHPYGHQKFETLGALGIVGFLSITCFELLRQGVHDAVRGEIPNAASIPQLALVAATMLVNVLVVWYERRRGERLQSAFLLADAAHTRSDVYVTCAALASLLLTRHGWGIVDPYLAIAVALVIARNGFEIVRRSVPVLVDERAIEAREIRQLLSAIPGVVDVRSVRSRAMASGVLLVEVTIGVDRSTSVEAAHRVSDAVEARLHTELGASSVTVHVEPA
jgi:cation diffusion facilitator family transporter